MKISEFKEYLTQIQEEHGDLEVKICFGPAFSIYDTYAVEKEDLHFDDERDPSYLYWYGVGYN